MRRVLALALVGVLVATAAVGPAVGDSTTTDSPPISGLTYYPVSDPQPTPPLSVGFSAQSNVSVFLVAENASGAVLGHTGRLDLRGGSAVDGLDVPTRANATGFHRVRVVAYADDGDGRFERAADRRLDAATDARRFLLPDRSGAGPLSVSPNPAVAGTPTTLHFDLPVERSVSLRRVALLTDYPAGLDAVAASDVTVTAGDTAVAATSVSARRGALVATLPRALAVDADTTVEVSVGGVRAPDPAATGRVTLVANPEHGALAGTTGLDAVRTTTPSSADGGGWGFLFPAAFPAFALLVGALLVALALRERG